MPEEIVFRVLRRALLTCVPAPGLVGHADLGGHYCGNAYGALLAEHGCQRSHSRRAECLDNAQAESLWSPLKTEELDAREWPVFSDLADAQQSVATYLTTTITSAGTQRLPAKSHNCFTFNSLKMHP